MSVVRCVVIVVMVGLASSASADALTFVDANCDLSGPPPSLGSSYQGDGQFSFDYWSDAGAAGHVFKYRLGIRNTSKKPLTIDWPAANFFRRAIAPGRAVPSECREDGNPLNTMRGEIVYGPLTQLRGPTASFYQAQRSDERAAAIGNPLRFTVAWQAVPEEGRRAYDVHIKVEGEVDHDGVSYTVGNYGDPITIEWPQVLTKQALETIRRTQPGLVDGGRLLVSRDSGSKLRFGDSKAVLRSGALSVYSTDGTLLWRDVRSGLTFGESPAPLANSQ